MNKHERHYYYHDYPLRKETQEALASHNYERITELLLPIQELWLDIGDIWALRAIIETKIRDRQHLESILEECFRFPIYDLEIEKEFVKAINISSRDWEKHLDELDWPIWDWEKMACRWLANPGALIRPATKETVHWFGGNDFQMPKCLGCGYKIHQWFFINIRAIEFLAKILSNWVCLPILGCNYCCMQLHRHDYQINFSTMDISLINVAIKEHEIKIYGKDYLEEDERLPEILPKQYAQLEWITPILNPTENDINEKYGCANYSRVGGEPEWVQYPVKVYCRMCRKEMAYVASLSSGTPGFEPTVYINNDCGFHYHFACNECYTLSVISHWT